MTKRYVAQIFKRSKLFGRHPVAKPNRWGAIQILESTVFQTYESICLHRCKQSKPSYGRQKLPKIQAGGLTDLRHNCTLSIATLKFTTVRTMSFKQEKPTKCGTKAADVLANYLAGKL